MVRLTSSMLWETDKKVLIQGCTCGLMAVLFSSVSPSCGRTRQRHIRHKRRVYLALPFFCSIHPVTARALFQFSGFPVGLSKVYQKMLIEEVRNNPFLSRSLPVQVQAMGLVWQTQKKRLLSA